MAPSVPVTEPTAPPVLTDGSIAAGGAAAAPSSVKLPFKTVRSVRPLLLLPGVTAQLESKVQKQLLQINDRDSPPTSVDHVRKLVRKVHRLQTHRRRAAVLSQDPKREAVVGAALAVILFLFAAVRVCQGKDAETTAQAVGGDGVGDASPTADMKARVESPVDQLGLDAPASADSGERVGGAAANAALAQAAVAKAVINQLLPLTYNLQQHPDLTNRHYRDAVREAEEEAVRLCAGLGIKLTSKSSTADGETSASLGDTVPDTDAAGEFPGDCAIPLLPLAPKPSLSSTFVPLPLSALLMLCYGWAEANKLKGHTPSQLLEPLVSGTAATKLLLPVPVRCPHTGSGKTTDTETTDTPTDGHLVEKVKVSNSGVQFQLNRAEVHVPVDVHVRAVHPKQFWSDAAPGNRAVQRGRKHHVSKTDLSLASRRHPQSRLLETPSSHRLRSQSCPPRPGTVHSSSAHLAAASPTRRHLLPTPPGTTVLPVPQNLPVRGHVPKPLVVEVWVSNGRHGAGVGAGAGAGSGAGAGPGPGGPGPGPGPPGGAVGACAGTGTGPGPGPVRPGAVGGGAGAGAGPGVERGPGAGGACAGAGTGPGPGPVRPGAVGGGAGAGTGAATGPRTTRSTRTRTAGSRSRIGAPPKWSVTADSRDVPKIHLFDHGSCPAAPLAVGHSKVVVQLPVTIINPRVMVERMLSDKEDMTGLPDTPDLLTPVHQAVRAGGGEPLASDVRWCTVCRSGIRQQWLAECTSHMAGQPAPVSTPDLDTLPLRDRLLHVAHELLFLIHHTTRHGITGSGVDMNVSISAASFDCAGVANEGVPSLRTSADLQDHYRPGDLTRSLRKKVDLYVEAEAAALAAKKDGDDGAWVAWKVKKKTAPSIVRNWRANTSYDAPSIRDINAKLSTVSWRTTDVEQLVKHTALVAEHWRQLQTHYQCRHRDTSRRRRRLRKRQVFSALLQEVAPSPEHVIGVGSGFFGRHYTPRGRRYGCINKGLRRWFMAHRRVVDTSEWGSSLQCGRWVHAVVLVVLALLCCVAAETPSFVHFLLCCVVLHDAGVGAKLDTRCTPRPGVKPVGCLCTVIGQLRAISGGC